MNFNKGDRVKLSQFGVDSNVFGSLDGRTKVAPTQRRGVVIGFSRDGTAVRVKWDHAVTPDRLFKGFLEKVVDEQAH